MVQLFIIIIIIIILSIFNRLFLWQRFKEFKTSNRNMLARVTDKLYIIVSVQKENFTVDKTSFSSFLVAMNLISVWL